MKRVLLAVVVSSVLAMPALASGPVPIDIEGPSKVAIPTVHPALFAAPLAQVEAPPLDEVLPVLANAAPNLIGPDGMPRWTVALPLLVYLLVFAVRKVVAPRLPEGLRDALQSQLGGWILAAASAIALAFLDFGMTGGTLTGAVALTLVLQSVYGFVFGVFGHTLSKDMLAKASAPAKPETAVETLTRAARGPQP